MPKNSTLFVAAGALALTWLGLVAWAVVSVVSWLVAK